MNSFRYCSAADYNTGTFINARVQQNYSLSFYNKDQVVADYDPLSGTLYNGSSAIPSPARTWAVTPATTSASTYYAGEFTDLLVQGASLQINYATSLDGAFVKHYIDGVNDENISLYGPVGGSVTVNIPLTNTRVQDVKIVHSGFANKSGSCLGPIQNTIGTTMQSAIQLQPNGTPIVSDTWTFTGLTGTTYQLKRNSTGTTQTLNYGQIYSLKTGNPAGPGLPGFDIFVSTGPGVGNAAAVAIQAPVLTINSYTVYKNFAQLSGWQTPIQDSGDQNSVWGYGYVEVPSLSSSAYISKVEVGSVLPVDATWTTFVPTESAVIDVPATQFTQPIRQLVNDLGQMVGRYSRVTFTMNDPNEFLQTPEIYYWDPNYETTYQLLPPIARGNNIQRFFSGILASYTRIRQRLTRFRNSLAVSTAEQEFLIQIGLSLGFPIRKNESLVNYRNRLSQTVILATSDSNLAPILNVIQSYLGNTGVYITVPSPNTAQWLLGSSTLGVNTFLGAKAFQYWAIQVHTPGYIPGMIPDVYESFVRSLLPIGCVPQFIYE